MTESDNRRCRDCLAYHELRSVEDLKDLSGGEFISFQGQGVGECRVHPPVRMEGYKEGVGQFPRVGGDTWCLKYTPIG